MMRSHLTIRGLPPEIGRRLEEERRRRGKSLNQTVVELLGAALGVRREEALDNGLGALAGRWSDAEAAAFEASTSCFEEIDPELWS